MTPYGIPWYRWSARERPSRRILGKRIQRTAHPPAAVIDVTEEFGPGEHTVRKGVGVLIKRLWRFPRLELSGEVVVEGQQRVVSQEPGGRAVQSPLRRWSGGRLVRPEVGLPQLVGTVHQRHVHQPQRSVEVAGNAQNKRVLHAFGIAQSDGTGPTARSGLCEMDLRADACESVTRTRAEEEVVLSW